MTLAEADPDAARPAWLDDLPRPALEAMLAAGREVLDWRRVLAKTGDNVVGEVLRHEGPFYLLDHYPKGDAFDPDSHSQWYYHAHDKKDRPGEHGHFHTFLRGGGMPAGIAPAPLSDFQPKPEQHDLICHLIAVSMDRSGLPIGLFTTNRWVTAETWYAAHDVAAMLDLFDLRISRPSWPVNRWLTSLLRLFRPEIEALLQERDERLRAWQRQHPEANAYEDRRLEVISQRPVRVETRIDTLERELGCSVLRCNPVGPGLKLTTVGFMQLAVDLTTTGLHQAVAFLRRSRSADSALARATVSRAQQIMRIRRHCGINPLIAAQRPVKASVAINYQFHTGRPAKPVTCSDARPGRTVWS